MDWVDALHETPDLCGEIKVLDYRAVFNGSYSCVYKGRMKNTGELVAIKVLNAIRGTGLSTMRRKIERERKTWSSLRHPNILPLYGFADDHKLFTPFGAFISPWRVRGDLGEFLFDEGENASLEVRLQLWQGVVAGVHYLHAHQPLLVHGDLKPGNILIDDNWNAQLCDFGLVRVYLSEGHSGMTTASPHCGTERYLAWELVMADEDAIPTAASDIYATGCIGLEALFLEQPYSRYKKNVRGQITRDMDEGKPPGFRPAGLVGHLGSLWELLSWCWASDPLSRPQAHVLSTHVSNILATVELLERSVSPWGTGQPQSGLWSPETRSKNIMATDRSGEMLVETPIPTNLTSDTNTGRNGDFELKQKLGIDSVVRQGGGTGGKGDQGDNGNDCMDIDEEFNTVSYGGRALATSVPTEVVRVTPRFATSSNFTFNDPLSSHLDLYAWPSSQQSLRAEEKPNKIFQSGSLAPDPFNLVEGSTYWSPNQMKHFQDPSEDHVMQERDWGDAESQTLAGRYQPNLNWTFPKRARPYPRAISSNFTLCSPEVGTSSANSHVAYVAPPPENSMYPHPQLSPAKEPPSPPMAPSMAPSRAFVPFDEMEMGSSSTYTLNRIDHAPDSDSEDFTFHLRAQEGDWGLWGQSGQWRGETEPEGDSRVLPQLSPGRSPALETEDKHLSDKTDYHRKRKLSYDGGSDTIDQRVGSALAAPRQVSPSGANNTPAQTPTGRTIQRNYYSPLYRGALGSPAGNELRFKRQVNVPRAVGSSDMHINPPVKTARPPSKKRRRLQEQDGESDSSDFYGDEATGQQPQQGGSNSGGQSARLPGACAPCKRLMMKCVFPHGQNDCCQRCRNSGRSSQCVVAPRNPRQSQKRGALLPPKLREQETVINSNDVVIKSLLEQVQNSHVHISPPDSPTIASGGGISVDLQKAPQEEKLIDKVILEWIPKAQAAIQSTHGFRRMEARLLEEGSSEFGKALGGDTVSATKSSIPEHNHSSGRLAGPDAASIKSSPMLHSNPNTTAIPSYPADETPAVEYHSYFAAPPTARHSGQLNTHTALGYGREGNDKTRRDESRDSSSAHVNSYELPRYLSPDPYPPFNQSSIGYLLGHSGDLISSDDQRHQYSDRRSTTDSQQQQRQMLALSPESFSSFESPNSMGIPRASQQQPQYFPQDSYYLGSGVLSAGYNIGPQQQRQQPQQQSSPNWMYQPSAVHNPQIATEYNYQHQGQPRYAQRHRSPVRTNPYATHPMYQGGVASGQISSNTGDSRSGMPANVGQHTQLKPVTAQDRAIIKQPTSRKETEIDTSKLPAQVPGNPSGSPQVSVQYATQPNRPTIKPPVQTARSPNKKRQRVQEPGEESDSSNYYGDEATGQQPQQGGSSAGGETTRLPGSCAPCRRLKMKCVFPEGQNECCQRCRNSGRAIQCVVGPRRPRGPPSDSKESLLQKLHEQDTVTKSKDAFIKSLFEQVPQVSLPDSPAIASKGGIPADLQNSSDEEEPNDKKPRRYRAARTPNSPDYSSTEDRAPDDDSSHSPLGFGDGHRRDAINPFKLSILDSGGNSKPLVTVDATGSHSIKGSGELHWSPLALPIISFSEPSPVDNSKEVEVVQEFQSRRPRSGTKSRSASGAEESKSHAEAGHSSTTGGGEDGDGYIDVAGWDYFQPELSDSMPHRPKWREASRNASDPLLTRPLSLESTSNSGIGSRQTLLPIPRPDAGKETCTICHITIRARNMERHRMSRHPNHIDGVSQTDNGAVVNDPIP